MSDGKNSLNDLAAKEAISGAAGTPGAGMNTGVGISAQPGMSFLPSSITANNSYIRVNKATPHVTNRAQTYGLQPLHEREMRSIYALFAWVANEQHVSQAMIRRVTAMRFGIADIADLRQKDYEDVIRFLVDLRLDELN